MRYAVIMAGGQGTRLWPAARRDSPKQLQRLIYDDPLITVTVKRLSAGFEPEHILVITAERYADPIRQNLPMLPADNVMSEPFGRNTAAAIALTAFRIARDDPDGMLAVFPADHVILHPDILLRAVNFGMDLAREHDVVDIGVPPGHAETGYGYIELGDVITTRDGLEAHRVKRFVEKPSLERAEEYLRAGNYMWNSGMFVWQARRFLDQLRTFLPETYEALDAAFADGSLQALQEAYEGIQDISVDYAIMEKVSDVVAIPADFGWRDIGDWNALYQLMDRDADGNASEGEMVTLDTRNSGFVAPNKLIAAIGVEDLIVVDTPDVLLLVRRDRTQDVKKILDELKARGDEGYL